ncbi:MAG: sulfite exporter TauE/SafE family protein [Bacteroidales bacterium]|nr:sulfite exporter TauE/SafE family protein [Bacteroidales bacterium]
MNILYTALVLGLLTGFHCIGMCGPIAIALPLNQKSWATRVISALWYNMGRTLTYATMGLVFGILGSGFSLAGFQRWISIAMGVFMIATVAFPQVNNALYKGTGNSKFMKGIRKKLSKHFTQASYKSLFIMGMLTGMLPCGMVYMALAGAIAVGNLGGSIMFMVLFGLGTIPMMFLMSMLGNFASLKLKHFINKAIPYVVVIVGLLFILRGLELGIKYISPPPEKVELQNHVKMRKMKMDKNSMEKSNMDKDSTKHM